MASLSNVGENKTRLWRVAWDDETTPRHAVGMKWNTMKAQSETQSLGVTLITSCPAFDTVQGRQLNMEERIALTTKPKRDSRDRLQHGRLPDEVELTVGMEVIVTFNVSTDLNMANEAR